MNLYEYGVTTPAGFAAWIDLSEGGCCDTVSASPSRKLGLPDIRNDPSRDVTA